MLTMGNFTRDEWNHLLCLFNFSHFSSTVCSDTMAKRSQQDSGEERVTAKSRPMMNPIARTPSHVSSSTSVRTGKRSYGSQDPWSLVAKKEERSGRPDIGIDRLKASDHYNHEQIMESFSSASYSKWDDDRVWSSQEWKTDIETYERSGRLDETSWRMTREVRPGFSHEETLHDGTAQSVRNEGNNSWQIEATWYRFSRRGKTSTIRYWKRWSRIGIVSRIKIIRESGEWSGAKKTEKDFECDRKWRRTFYDLGNVYGCYNGIRSIHGK